MATVRKHILEFQPSVDVLQQIVASAENSNYDTVRTLLTQSMRPKSKKDKISSSSSTQWHENLILLNLYASIQCASSDHDDHDDDTHYHNEDELPIPSEWKTTITTTSSTSNGGATTKMSMTIPNQIYRLLQAYRYYYQQQNYSKVIHLYQQNNELLSNTPVEVEGRTSKVSSNIQLAWEHLYAQSLHHVQNGTTALQVYRSMIEQISSSSSRVSSQYRPEQVVQLYTNYVATLLSYFAIPYCRTTNGLPEDKIMVQIRQFVLTQLSKQPPNDQHRDDGIISSLYCDLSYNVATYYLLTTTSTDQERQEWLQVLFSYSHHRNENSNDDQSQKRFKDQFSLRLNYKLFREYVWNMSVNHKYMMHPDTNELLSITNSLTQLSLQQQCVYRMNDAMLSLQGSMSFGNQASPPEQILQHLISEYSTVKSKSNAALTILQQHIVHYNIATYQYRCQQYTNCQQTCQQYFLSTGLGKPHKKKKKSTTTTMDGANPVDSTIFEISAPAQYPTMDEKLFWECRATVLLAHCTVALVLSPTSPTTTDENSSAENTSNAEPTDEATKTISAAIDTLNPFCVSPSTSEHSVHVCNHVLLYARLHQLVLRSKLSNPTNDSTSVAALQMLESLPEEIRTKSTLQSTILKHKRPNMQNESIRDKPTVSKLQEMVQTIGSSKSSLQFQNGMDVPQYIGYADFAVSKQRYADATVLYEAVIKAGKVDTTNSDYTTIMAKYVRALSYVRPNDAIAVWSKCSASVTVPDLMPTDHGTTGLTSGSELEMKEIIFPTAMAIGSSAQSPWSTTQPTNETLDDTATKPKKKRHEAVLRQRAKKRELFLQQKVNGNAGTSIQQQTPDPERWLPKYERSNYMKYRRNKKGNTGGGAPSSVSHKSAQGVVTVQEMAKLDVVAHQTAVAAAAIDGQAMDASTIRSTAHMNVSNKGRTGKKRR